MKIRNTTLTISASSVLPARDRIIDFGKHKGKMLGTLPSKYLKWVSKNLRARDFEQWAKLADEVLQDPVYKDRLEWEFAENLLTGDNHIHKGSSSSTTDTSVDDLLEFSQRFGWDYEDKLGWSRIDFSLLGTSKGCRIPRKNENSFRKKTTTNNKLMIDVGEKREVRIERRRMKRGIKMNDLDLDLEGKNVLEEKNDVGVHQQHMRDTESVALVDNTFEKLPDHLVIEIFIRVPISDWAQVACVTKHWAYIFRGECLWQSALLRTWPLADQGKRWPGPIPRGLCRRRYAALYVSKHIFAFNDEIDEIMGHTYLFLKEQLEHATLPSSGILHGTIIDQFIACGKSRDKAHELASQIWLAVIDNMEENEHTFLLLKHLVQETDVFLPYPYSRPYKVQWRVFEKLFTDFRDCFNRIDYYDILASAKYKFQHIPASWLGY
ncbi:hypothetical protein AQUCO_01800126v1 [Aquilegia coerulea]|uniref:F-box domain-containing protein n=1 Tax=Aquilegia coerulea TaxID=218851 RepID=A0A2G5DK52_AQUCA|nr:hypothetical protein AQUCO_01800126v1 [Aquilegia coerulea]